MPSRRRHRLRNCDPARLAQRTRAHSLLQSVPGIAPALVTEAMSDHGIGIRDGHMYTPPLSTTSRYPTGVRRSARLPSHYNTVEEIQEFGKVFV